MVGELDEGREESVAQEDGEGREEERQEKGKEETQKVLWFK